MKKISLALLAVLTLGASIAYAQLVGTQKIQDNYWFSADKKIKFGAYPNAEINYDGTNLVIDVVHGGGKVSIPDGIDLGASSLSLGSSLVFEGNTADAFETTFAITDPTSDKTITFPNQSGAAILSVGGVVDTANAISGGTGTFIFEGTTADAFETTLAVVDPTADQTWSIPNFAVSAAFMGSTLTTNNVDAANSVWGISNSLVFEGATADAFETTVTVVDPTSDKTVTIPNQTGTFLMSTAAQDAGDSIKGVASGLEFEGSAADANETTISITNPTADRTVTVPDAGGTVILGGNTTITSGANTACNTTCGASTKCIAGQDAGASNVLVACSSATADVCICSVN